MMKDHKLKVNDISIRNELETQINDFQQAQKNEENLVDDMALVKSLYA